MAGQVTTVAQPRYTSDNEILRRTFIILPDYSLLESLLFRIDFDFDRSPFH